MEGAGPLATQGRLGWFVPHTPGALISYPQLEALENMCCFINTSFRCLFFNLRKPIIFAKFLPLPLPPFCTSGGGGSGAEALLFILHDSRGRLEKKKCNHCMNLFFFFCAC
jgi:hypothetical protein